MISLYRSSLREVLLARDRGQQHLAAPFALADGPHLDPRRRRGQRAEVGIDVLRVRELFRRADDVAEGFLRRRDSIRRGQVIDKLGEEKRFRRVLADLGGVTGVDRLCRRVGSLGTWRSASRRPVRSGSASVRSIIGVVPGVCGHTRENTTGWTEEWEVSVPAFVYVGRGTARFGVSSCVVAGNRRVTRATISSARVEGTVSSSSRSVTRARSASDLRSARATIAPRSSRWSSAFVIGRFASRTVMVAISPSVIGSLQIAASMAASSAVEHGRK